MSLLRGASCFVYSYVHKRSQLLRYFGQTRLAIRILGVSLHASFAPDAFEP